MIPGTSTPQILLNQDPADFPTVASRLPHTTWCIPQSHCQGSAHVWSLHFDFSLPPHRSKALCSIWHRHKQTTHVFPMDKGRTLNRIRQWLLSPCRDKNPHSWLLASWRKLLQKLIQTPHKCTPHHQNLRCQTFSSPTLDCSLLQWMWISSLLVCGVLREQLLPEVAEVYLRRHSQTFWSPHHSVAQVVNQMRQVLVGFQNQLQQGKFPALFVRQQGPNFRHEYLNVSHLEEERKPMRSNFLETFASWPWISDGHFETVFRT